MKNKYFMTIEKFISKCIEKHVNKYDYDDIIEEKINTINGS